MLKRKNLTTQERYDRVPESYMKEPLAPKTRRELLIEIAAGTTLAVVLTGVAAIVSEHASSNDSTSTQEAWLPAID